MTPQCPSQRGCKSERREYCFPGVAPGGHLPTSGPMKIDPRLRVILEDIFQSCVRSGLLYQFTAFHLEDAPAVC